MEYIDEDNNTCEERVKKLKRTLKECRKVRQKYLEGWQRAQADFLNFKKVQESGISEFRQFAARDTILKILPVLDNLELACAAFPAEANASGWAKGVVNVKKQLMNVLTDCGLEEVKAAKGEKFNPEYHEAIEETADKGESGTIAEVTQKGYTLQGKMIRPARVKVNK